MLTLAAIKENPDDIIRRLARKHFDAKELIEKVIETDKVRRATQAELDSALSQIKTLSSQIGMMMKNGEKEKVTVAKQVSKMFAPAYMSLGLGIDYKPGNGKELSINLAPLTGNLVIVAHSDTLIQKKYGNAAYQTARWELGAQFKATLNNDLIKNLKINTALTLFSDYLNKPKNMQVNWDMQLTYKLNKYMQTGIRTNLIYDDNILFTSNRMRLNEKTGEMENVMQPRVQLQEVFSINFAYTFGVFKK